MWKEANSHANMGGKEDDAQSRRALRQQPVCNWSVKPGASEAHARGDATESMWVPSSPNYPQCQAGMSTAAKVVYPQHTHADMETTCNLYSERPPRPEQTLAPSADSWCDSWVIDLSSTVKSNSEARPSWRNTTIQTYTHHSSITVPNFLL